MNGRRSFLKALCAAPLAIPAAAMAASQPEMLSFVPRKRAGGLTGGHGSEIINLPRGQNIVPLRPGCVVLDRYSHNTFTVVAIEEAHVRVLRFDERGRLLRGRLAKASVTAIGA